MWRFESCPRVGKIVNMSWRHFTSWAKDRGWEKQNNPELLLMVLWKCLWLLDWESMISGEQKWSRAVFDSRGLWICRRGGCLPLTAILFSSVPVSLPVLTLRVSRAQAVVGDVAELHCEALRGSPPILYQFYHDKVALGNSSTSSRGGVSFNLSLTTEHSGNYSCQAGNGLGAQQSQTVSLTVTGKQDTLTTVKSP